MTISLQNQTIIVTGGAVRLGRAIALACAEAGANVGFSYNRSEAEAQATLAELRQSFPDARFAAWQVELTDSAQIALLAHDAVQTFGRVDALVNNAAIFRRTPFETLSEADFDEHIATNLKAPFLLCKQFGDLFVQQQSGSIVNIADIHGLRPLRNYAPYCISKAGVVMLTQTLALALSPHVRVNCICPGTILLPSQTQGEDDEEEVLTRKIPLGRLGNPEQIAQTVLFLLGGPDFISGAILPIDGAQRLR